MAWVSTGTVTVTNGSAGVAGSATPWFGALQAGWGFIGPDGRTYEILSVNSATSLTLASPYLGASGAAQAYSAFPTMSLAPDLAATFQAIATGFQAMIDTVGVGKFNDGTVAAPGLRFEVDPDTGLQRPASNTLALIGGGVELLRLAASGASGAAVQSSLADATPGLLALVGGFGLGVETYLAVPGSDIDATTLPTGSYRVVSSLDAGVFPAPGTFYGVLDVKRYSATDLVQFLHRVTAGKETYKRTYTAGAWSAWVLQDLVGGSNANGEYVRFGDGTQICTNDNAAITTAPAAFVGTITKIDGDKLWLGRWF